MPGYPVVNLLNDFRVAYPGEPVVLISGYLPETILAQGGLGSDIVLLRNPFSLTRLVGALERQSREVSRSSGEAAAWEG